MNTTRSLHANTSKPITNQTTTNALVFHSWHFSPFLLGLKYRIASPFSISFGVFGLFHQSSVIQFFTFVIVQLTNSCSAVLSLLAPFRRRILCAVRFWPKMNGISCTLMSIRMFTSLLLLLGAFLRYLLLLTRSLCSGRVCAMRCSGGGIKVSKRLRESSTWCI